MPASTEAHIQTQRERDPDELVGGQYGDFMHARSYMSSSDVDDNNDDDDDDNERRISVTRMPAQRMACVQMR